MRAASRLLAAVKSVRYLEAGTPTGLTGLLTHQSPRSTLIYLYSSTLDKLKRIPDTSVYRQSTEALTRQRLALVESFVPEGLEAWQERLKKQMEEHPGLLERDGASVTELKDGSTLVRLLVREESGDEWDGEDARPEPEGERSESERKRQWEGVDTSNFEEELRSKDVKLEMEPPLTAEQYVLVRWTTCLVRYRQKFKLTWRQDIRARKQAWRWPDRRGDSSRRRRGQAGR